MDANTVLRDYLDTEAIKTLKYSYIRHMTLSKWDSMEELLTEDVETSYADGKYVFSNRSELMDFLRASNDKNSGNAVAYWQVGMPEILLTSETTATGIWSMYHFYLNKADDQQLEMFCYYSDSYEKVDGEWKIAKTAYKQVMEQSLDRTESRGFILNVG